VTIIHLATGEKLQQFLALPPEVGK
jgi:hypothetical protein